MVDGNLNMSTIKGCRSAESKCISNSRTVKFVVQTRFAALSVGVAFRCCVRAPACSLGLLD